jgi:hypothetical protein
MEEMETCQQLKDLTKKVEALEKTLRNHLESEFAHKV